MSGRRPTIAAIQHYVAAEYGIDVAALLSASRTPAIVEARHVAMWLCRQLTPATATVIAGQFGGRDRKTVAHALRRIGERMEAEPDLVRRLESLREKVLAGETDCEARSIAVALRAEARALVEQASRLDALAASYEASG